MLRRADSANRKVFIRHHALASERHFFYAATTLLFIVAVASRLVLAYSDAFEDGTQREIVSLLHQPSFPQREEVHETILAAVNASLVDKRSLLDARTEVQHLHEAFREIERAAVYSTDAKTDSLHAVRIGEILTGTCTSNPRLLSDLAQRFAYYRSPKQNEEIDECAVKYEGFPTERLYGNALCDKKSGALTKLLVPSRAVSGNVARRQQVLDANDLSWTMEDVIGIVCQPESLLDPYTEKSATTPTLVQAYFISPLGFIRYWDRDGTLPYLSFGPSHFWGATPFMEILLDEQQRSLRANPDLTREELRTILQKAIDEKLSTPYIDYGGYGLVLTQCTAVVGADKGIVGVFCTDVTVPLRLEQVDERKDGWIERHWPFRRQASRQRLFTHQLVRISQRDGCSVSALASSADVDDDIKKWICSKVGPERQAFFRRVQAFPEGDPANTFLVPLQRFQSPDGALRALLLQPESPRPPVYSLFVMVVAIFALIALIVWRVLLERKAYRSLREESILRDLQVGVIDVADGWTIVGGNDRAEEILGERLPMLGSEWDSADPLDLRDVFEKPFMHDRADDTGEQAPGEDTERFIPITVSEVEHYRRLGLAFPYYARFRDRGYAKAAAATQRASESAVELLRWILVDGTPVLERGELAHPWTFAVIRRVGEKMNRDLERKWLVAKGRNVT